MKVLIQRVKQAKCIIDDATFSEINEGLCLFVSFQDGDTEALIKPMVKKVLNLRIFEDNNGKMNDSVLDVQGDVLSISQFTLEANTQKGHRPSFTNALNPSDAEQFYTLFNTLLKTSSLNVKTGSFQSHMTIDLLNDGPVTILLERT